MRKQVIESERYFCLSVVIALITNLLAFQGSRLLEKGRIHHDLTTPLDPMIPFLPWTVVIYLGCFLFWVYVYWVVAKLPRQTADRFFCANLLGKGVSFLFFTAFPTAITRPDLQGLYAADLWQSALRVLYWIDAPDNLFPSLHCMISWLCWVGIRRNRQVPLTCQAFALLMAVAVCLSTLTTRQHVLPDVAGGILLSELCYACAGGKTLLRAYSSLTDRILSGTKLIKEKLML